MFILQQIWRTLTARLLLTTMTVVALTLSATAPWWITAIKRPSAVGTLRTVPIELELDSDRLSLRDSLVRFLRDRSDLAEVLALSRSDVRAEIAQELGDSLAGVLAEQDFPAIVRLKLSARTFRQVQMFLHDVTQWPGVTKAVYPEEAVHTMFENHPLSETDWHRYTLIAQVSLWVLAGMLLRTLFARRRPVWLLLSMLGWNRRNLFLAKCGAGVVVGLAAASVTIVIGGLVGLETSLLPDLREISGPVAALVLGLIAPLWSATTSRTNSASRG